MHGGSLGKLVCLVLYSLLELVAIATASQAQAQVSVKPWPVPERRCLLICTLPAACPPNLKPAIKETYCERKPYRGSIPSFHIVTSSHRHRSCLVSLPLPHRATPSVLPTY